MLSLQQLVCDQWFLLMVADVMQTRAMLCLPQVIFKQLEVVDDDALHRTLFKKMAPPLVTLLSAEPEIQYVALRNINLIVQKYPTILAHEVKVRAAPGFIALFAMLTGDAKCCPVGASMAQAAHICRRSTMVSVTIRQQLKTLLGQHEPPLSHERGAVADCLLDFQRAPPRCRCSSASTTTPST